MDLHAVLQAQASLFIFLGFVVLLAHQTSRYSESNCSGHWFFAASLCGGLGLALRAESGQLPLIVSIIGGNLLFLLLTVLLTRSIELLTGSTRRSLPYLSGLVVVTTLALAYFTFYRPNVSRRVLIASIAVPLLLLPATRLLLRVQERTIRVATRTLAAIILLFDLGCLIVVVKIFRGATPQSNASWGGVILIAGVALCFLWIDLVRTRAELEMHALTDPLTGLLNRRAMESFASRELARAARHDSAITLFSIDVDNFKDINDRYGHAIGDAALSGIANLLRASLRATDFAARTGGDEFVVMLIESSPHVARTIQERIQVGIRGLSVSSHDGRHVPVSVSIGGYTTTSLEQETYADMVHASDMDLYRQKQARSAVPKQAVQLKTRKVPVSSE